MVCCIFLHQFDLSKRAFFFQFPLAILAIICLGLHLPKTESSDFFAKVRRVDFGGAVTLIPTFTRARQGRQHLLSRQAHNALP